MEQPQLQIALRQVSELKDYVIAKQKFRGVSGRARGCGGILAVITAAILASPLVPMTVEAHISGWLTLFVVAAAINFGAISYWFLNSPDVNRELRRLKPLLDLFPALIMGGVISASLLANAQFDLLFGVWMCMFGLSNLASRHVLPGVTVTGFFYLTVGTACLLLPSVTFLNPWPMGVIFASGELYCGTVMHLDQTRHI